MQNPLSPFIKPFTTSVPPISSNPPILLSNILLSFQNSVLLSSWVFKGSPLTNYKKWTPIMLFNRPKTLKKFNPKSLNFSLLMKKFSKSIRNPSKAKYKNKQKITSKRSSFSKKLIWVKTMHNFKRTTKRRFNFNTPF